MPALGACIPPCPFDARCLLQSCIATALWRGGILDFLSFQTHLNQGYSLQTRTGLHCLLHSGGHFWQVGLCGLEQRDHQFYLSRNHRIIKLEGPIRPLSPTPWSMQESQPKQIWQMEVQFSLECLPHWSIYHLQRYLVPLYCSNI